jgi:hypothetical protein
VSCDNRGEKPKGTNLGIWGQSSRSPCWRGCGRK